MITCIPFFTCRYCIIIIVGDSLTVGLLSNSGQHNVGTLLFAVTLSLFSLLFMTEFEKKLGIPPRTIRDVSVGRGKDSAFLKLERGELTAEEFEVEFSKECSEKVHLGSFLLSIKMKWESEGERNIPVII